MKIADVSENGYFVRIQSGPQPLYTKIHDTNKAKKVRLNFNGLTSYGEVETIDPNEELVEVNPHMAK